MPGNSYLQARTPSTTEIISRFLRYAARFSPNTLRCYKQTLYRLAGNVPSDINRVTAEHIDIFLQTLQIANSTKNTYLMQIKSLFSFCETYLDLPNPTKSIKKLPELPPNQRVVSPDEYTKILKACKEKEGGIVKVLANTGLRSQEFCDLRPQNISFDKKYLTITGKGGKRRIVPLNDICRENLSLIFSKSLTPYLLYLLCQKLSSCAAIPRFGPHALRHFFCTRMIRKGVDITKVSKIMGHASIAITESIYLHLLPVDFLGVTDVLEI